MSKLLNFFRVNKSIAIDLGTSNILIYDKQKGKIVLNEPSIVAKDVKTGKIIAVGEEARDMFGKTPDSIVTIRPLREGVISDIDATREMLAAYIRKVYGSSLIRPEVMICVPIEVTTVERRALFDAITDAKKIYLLEEGRAAVLGSGIDISLPEGNMVIDVGGGSTDIAILSIDEIIASKSIRIASNRFDQDIVRYIKKNYNLLIGERTAEKIKREIGTVIPMEKPDIMSIKGRALNDGIPKTLEIDANDIQEAIIDSIREIIAAVKELLERCPPELASDILDNGIVLTGGGSLIRNFDTLLERELRLKIVKASNPLEAVVLGGGLVFENKRLLRTLHQKEK